MLSSERIKGALGLLSLLIETPSFSREEDKTADILVSFLNEKGIDTNRCKNNVWVKNKHFDPEKKTLLLNSHHDTVKPNQGYTVDPFEAIIKDDKLYGLGSNDAGASLVGLLFSFLHFYNYNLPFNIIWAASAEEEVSGKDGMEYLVGQLPLIWAAIVGEPTKMEAAIAEKGLMVIDATAIGKAGHSARNEGLNAINIALKDIISINDYQFDRNSEMLGDVRKSVTIINAGSQHNVVPDRCQFTIDVRTTDAYTNQETLEILQSICQSTLVARSTRLNPSGISKEHPLFQVAYTLGINTYGSPTLSDQALMPWDSIKMGIGDSARSHTADEFVYLRELENGISDYIKFIDHLTWIMH